MCSGRGDGPLRPPGFPIRKSPDLTLVADSPGLIAGSYVLLRLLVPRHPPCALINLATTDDARVHCAVLKIRAVPATQPPVSFDTRVLRHCGGGGSGPTEVISLAAVPSGPNSVLGLVTPADPRSTLACLTMRTVLANRGKCPRPNSQCSTNELATERHSLPTWLWANCRSSS